VPVITVLSKSGNTGIAGPALTTFRDASLLKKKKKKKERKKKNKQYSSKLLLH
jgi:hypothetical protein